VLIDSGMVLTDRPPNGPLFWMPVIALGSLHRAFSSLTLAPRHASCLASVCSSFAFEYFPLVLSRVTPLMHYTRTRVRRATSPHPDSVMYPFCVIYSADVYCNKPVPPATCSLTLI
jgi:hypothetical protein